MRFRKDNKIMYGQDFRFGKRGVPSGVEFRVEPFKEGMYRLTGDGYGQHGSPDSYGNGALYVYGLTSQQRKRFERCLEHQAKSH